MKLSTALFMAIMVMIMVVPGKLHGQDKGKIDQDRERTAKERQEMGDKIKASKIAYITEHVELTPGEAEKFWPIYNEQEKKREELTHSIMERFKGPMENEDISDEQAEELMQQRFSQEQALLDLKKEYHAKYSKILASNKVLKLYEAENNFRRQLMERMKHHEVERKPEGRGMAPPHRGRTE